MYNIVNYRTVAAGAIGAAFMLTMPLVSAEVARTGAVATADYWVAKETDGDKIILNSQELEKFNQKIRTQSGAVIDLANYPTELTREALQAKIYAAMQDYNGDMPSGVYKGAAALTWSDWQSVRKNCNIDNLPQVSTVRYAVTTKRGNLRLLPTSDGYYSSPNDIHYDDLQGTAIDPAQAVAVLADSLDGKFSFVETSDYSGWLSNDVLAATSRESWLKFAAPKQFAVVTANKILLGEPNSSDTALYQMGATIPYQLAANAASEVMLELPTRAADGNLVVKPFKYNWAEKTLNNGYLPYTANNTIRQAFKFLGDVYGWGGQDDSVDCSSFIQDIYRSMGILLPRDADTQNNSFADGISLSGLSTYERYANLKAQKSGAILYKPGHIMLYLGTDDNGTPLIIHSMSSYYDFNTTPPKHYIRQVVVSDLEFTNWQNVKNINALTRINSIR